MQKLSFQKKWPVYLGCLIFVILSINSVQYGGDFDVYLDAARKLQDGQNIYEPPLYHGLQYYYSPLFALLLVPLSGTVFIAELLWLLLSGYLLYRSWVLITRYFDLEAMSKKAMRLWTALSFFFVIRFLIYNINSIQITIFLMWAALASIALIKSDKQLLGAGLLALAINIKVMPIVVVPYLLYRGYFKSVGLVMVFSVIYLFLPALVIGVDFNQTLLASWWETINPAKAEYTMETHLYTQSLGGMIPVFVTETLGEFPYQRNFLDLTEECAMRVTNVVRFLLISCTLFFLKSPFQRRDQSLEEIRALSYIFLMIPLAFPHQMKYAFIFVFPAVAYLSYYCILRYKTDNSTGFKICLGALLIVSVIFSPFIGGDLLGRQIYDQLQYFRVLGIGTLLLAAFLFFSPPGKCIEQV